MSGPAQQYSPRIWASSAVPSPVSGPARQYLSVSGPAQQHPPCIWASSAALSPVSGPAQQHSPPYLTGGAVCTAHSRCLGELSPVCAVVGGVLAQEVIKAVSQKDKPLNNFFLFDGYSSEGVVETIAA